MCARTVCQLGVAVLLASSASVLGAEPPRVAASPAPVPATAPSVPRRVQILTLKHASPSSVCKIIQPTLGGRVVAVPDERTRSLVVAAEADDLSRVAELVAHLDRPSVSEPSAAVTRFFRLQHREAKDVYEVFRTAGSGRSRFGVDRAGEFLVVQGPEADVATVGQLVEALDIPKEPKHTLSLEFFFVHSNAGEKQEAGKPLPKVLAPVAEALAKAGLENLTLMTTLLIRSEENSEFQAQGKLGGAPEPPSELEVTARGTAKLQDERPAASLKISAQVEREQTRASDIRRVKVFSVETCVVVPLGDYVVLAATPTEEPVAGGTSAIVVRIDVAGR